MNLSLTRFKGILNFIFILNIVFLFSIDALAAPKKKRRIRVRPPPGPYFHDFETASSLRASYWTDSRKQDDWKKLGSASLWTKMKGKLGYNGKYVLDGWIRNDENMQGSAKGDLREAYGGIFFGSLDIAVGRQLVVWGRADTINPTDNLSTRNYQLLTPDDEDQKSGAGMAKLIYNFESFRLIGFYIPEFRPHKLPISETSEIIYSDVKPEQADRQHALKIESLNGESDWSLSYFEGFDKTPDLQLLTDPEIPLPLSLVYTRIRTYGADYAFNFDRYGFRAEAAYTVTQDPRGEDHFIKNPFFFSVIGGDRTFLDSLNINLQYLYRHIYAFQDPRDITDSSQELAILDAIINNQYDQNQHGGSLRISNKWMNETLEAELTLVGWLQHKDYLLRPKIRYAWNDYVKIVLGSDMYRGPLDSYFGSLNKISTTYFELQWNF